jgi:hypothetical protein
MNKDLNLLIDSVLGRANSLGSIYKEYGNYSLYEYVNLWQVKNNAFPNEFIFSLTDLINEYYPVECGEIIGQLKQVPLVSTIDHYGILNHPFFINANLVYSLRKELKYLINFPTAGVSLNNSSWPGSLIRFCPNHQARWSFFPDKAKHLPVLSAPAITPDNKILETLPEEIRQALQGNNSLKEYNYLKQASLLSTGLWHLIFPQASKVIYIPLEKLVNKLLVDVIIPNQSHPLHVLCFSLEGWQLLEKYFWEVKGAFGKNFGSFLFWGINAKGERVSLTRAKHNLVGENFQGELSPEKFLDLINTSSLYPTSLVCFIVLMYYNLTLLGGFNQVNWLTIIKGKLIELWHELGYLDLIQQLSDLPMENFAEGNLSFLSQGEIIYKPSAIDILLSQSNNLYNKYVALAKNMTVAESIQTLLPEIYKITVPKADRQKRLEQWSDLDIIQEIGLQKKIKVELDF